MPPPKTPNPFIPMALVISNEQPRSDSGGVVSEKPPFSYCSLHKRNNLRNLPSIIVRYIEGLLVRNLPTNVVRYGEEIPKKTSSHIFGKPLRGYTFGEHPYPLLWVSPIAIIGKPLPGF
jgi:hypothetical protein